MAVMSIEQLKAMVYKKLSERGLETYWPLIDYIVTNESGWNPSIQSSATDPNTGKRENSWGLFQQLIDSSMGTGLGAGYTPQELQNPETNTDIALDHIKNQLDRGIGLQEAVDDWTVTHGVDVNTILQQGGTAPTGTPTESAWKAPPALAAFAPPTQGLPSLGGTTDTTGFGYQPVNPQEQFLRQYPFTQDEQKLITDLTNMVDVGQLEEDQAWKILEEWRGKENITTYRAQEATTRGTELLSGAFPGTTLPMTGSGGMGESLQKQYGLPNLTPAVQGLPMSQAAGMYGQAQEGLGLPAQLSPLQQPNIQLPNWGNFMKNMPTFGGGNKYIDALLREGRTTAPQLG